MTIFQSIFLGIIQGLTEFLPISSSAHLVIFPYVLGWEIDPQEAFIFNVLVQVATLFAVIFYFKNELKEIVKQFVLGLKNRNPFSNPDSKLGWCIIIATIPAGLVGVIIKDYVEMAFQSSLFVAIALFANAVILAFSEVIGKRTRSLDNISFSDGFWIGVAQVISIFPGISRSGSTMAGGLTRNFNRTSTAKFSFLLSIPIMLAAGLYTSLDLLKIPDFTGYLWVFIPGFISAAVVGYFSIRWLIGYLVKRSFYIFSIYCALVGILILGIYWARS
jgi:undecaprenyl-diphosphatase